MDSLSFPTTSFAIVVRKCLAAICLSALLSGCATMYVDGALSGASATQVKKPTDPHPVQLLFNFKTKGVANSRATAFLKDKVEKVALGTGLFSAVSAAPVSNNALLSITLDNVPITDEKDAMSKGFATGLTFGLVGSVVTDGYICTVEYINGIDSLKLSTKAQHMIHTAVGAKSAPKNSIKAKNPNEAVLSMTEQIVTAAMADLSKDPAFK